MGVALYLGSAIGGWLITPVLALPVFAGRLSEQFVEELHSLG